MFNPSCCFKKYVTKPPCTMQSLACPSYWGTDLDLTKIIFLFYARDQLI